MKPVTIEIIKKISEEFKKVSDSADCLEEKAGIIIDKYEIKDRKDKNRKWLGIISDLNLSDDDQGALNLAVARVLRANK
jgi:hypothetical protein